MSMHEKIRWVQCSYRLASSPGSSLISKEKKIWEVPGDEASYG